MTTIIMIIALIGLLLSNIMLYIYLKSISDLIKDINLPFLPKIIYHAIYIDDKNKEVYERIITPNELGNDYYFLTIIPRVGEEIYYQYNHGYITKVTYHSHPDFGNTIDIYFELSEDFNEEFAKCGEYYKINVDKDVNIFNKDVYRAERKYKTNSELEKEIEHQW